MPEDNTTPTPSIPPVDPSVIPTPDSTNPPAAEDITTAVPAPQDAPAPTEPASTEPAGSPIVEPVSQESVPVSTDSTALYPELANKINEAKNVLIALSSDPSVDEMAAAIGLSLFLDRLGKRATAIYSGTTPNALEFLKPEETFESTADTLQDFVIALSKEKADHLRYKLDGDFVKIYITPYKTRISKEDLDFSYGDYNVDLVLALDVANGIDLDSALREHGRIMHDAVIINITTGKPGKFGEIEWSDKHASSVSEMIAGLLYGINTEVKIEKEEATAFLTGIVAATNRFSNAGTTPTTMQIASKLMESGANQQLVSKNITPDIENEMAIRGLTSSANDVPASEESSVEEEAKPVDPTKLDISHPGDQGIDETKEVDATVTEKESSLLDDLKAAEASLAQTGAETTPEAGKTTLTIHSDKENDFSVPNEESSDATEAEPSEPAKEEPESVAPEAPASETTASKVVEPKPEESQADEPKSEESQMAEVKPEEPQTSEPAKEEPEPSDSILQPSEKVLQPTSSDSSSTPSEDDNKYGHMLEEALNSLNTVASVTPTSEENPSPVSPTTNPAMANAPTVSSNPEINGVPEINYMPMPGEEVLPPPPAPPIDMSNISAPSDLPVGQDNLAASPTVSPAMPPVEPIIPAAPAAAPQPTSLGDQPAMQDQVYGPQSSDPGAFKIPGM